MPLLRLIAPLTLLLAAPAFADEPEPTVLLDQSFTLHASAEDADEPMGLYALHAEQAGNQITITESVELATRNSTIDMSSVVIYKQDKKAGWLFQGATAATGVDGADVMKVSVEPKDTKWLVKTTFISDDQGKPLGDPHTKTRTLDIPKGPVLFSSARAVIGPRLQPRPGQQPIVWVEFPDDIDEDINIKQGFSLVREEPDQAGTYHLWIKSDHQTLGPLPLNQAGQLKPHQLWGKMLMREE